MKGQVEKFDLSLMGYKEKYTINEINLMGKGDILILYTDGLSELADQQGNLYFPEHLETVLRRVKTLSAKEIFGAIKEDLLSFGRRQDDLSFVIIKKE
ncbi:MAG: Stage II sporulation protein E (SpoIIE) [Candidatus Aminicenantes bacterium ADurb.Bin508]|nr:MAG: Stage II sporulation protein E (SpoIIE) [Candidatus Aminicenantes bacterium ADurb.Bin508]